MPRSSLDLQTWWTLPKNRSVMTASRITGRDIPHGATAPSGPGPPHYRGFMITLRHATLGRTRHNTHKRQQSMPPAGFEPAIPASERLQTHPLDRGATGIGTAHIWMLLFWPRELYEILQRFLIYDICGEVITWIRTGRNFSHWTDSTNNYGQGLSSVTWHLC